MKKLLIFVFTALVLIGCFKSKDTNSDSIHYTEETLKEEKQIPTKNPNIKVENNMPHSARNQEVVVHAFYTALSENKCEQASYIRPGYSKERCLAISDTIIEELYHIGSNEKYVLFSMSLKYKEDNVDKQYSGFLALEKINDNWYIIHNSYKTLPSADLDTYLSTYGIYKDIQKAKVEEKIEAKEPKLDYENTSLMFGSSAILASCWSPNQLQGNITDKKVIRPVNTADSVHIPFRNDPIVKLNKLPEYLKNSIRRVVPDGKKIALTFDLCERALEVTGYDAEIVNYLRKNNIKATFFAGGKWMLTHPEKAKQLMADPLFEIGNHAWTHGNLRVLKGLEMRQQILWTQVQYERIREELKNDINMQKCPNVNLTEMNKIPAVPLTFRFPYGTCSRESLNALAEFGLPAIQWDVVTADPVKAQSAQEIARTVLNNVKPGSIIIAHANGRGYSTAESLSLFIPQLKKQGYEFVTVTELLNSAKEIESTTECYELRPGDNLRYDRIFGKGTQ